jgi:hypothetical protein
MGEFSYTPTDSQAPYGDFAAGYQESEASDFHSGYGFQAEAAGLVGEEVPMLGAILKEQGLLDDEKLAAALTNQLASGVTFAQVVLDLGFVAPDQLLQALQLRARYG